LRTASTRQKAAAYQPAVKTCNVTSPDSLHWPLVLDETQASSIIALASSVSASASGNRASFKHSGSTQAPRHASTAAYGVYATAPDLPGAVPGLASSLCLHLPLARCVGSGLASIDASVPRTAARESLAGVSLASQASVALTSSCHVQSHHHRRWHSGPVMNRRCD